MKKQLILLTVMLVIFGQPGRADQITLQNGDRITGTILRFEGEELEIQSDLLGTITVAWDAVDELESDEILQITLSDEREMLGRVSVRGSEMTVETPDAGTIRMPRSALRMLESQAGEPDSQPDPPLTDLWTAALDAALSLTDGNADTRTMHVGMQAGRSTPRDRTSLYFTSLFANNSTSGESVTTANAVRGGFRYEIDVSNRLFTFGFTDLEFDRFQDLDLRLVLGGGLGAHLLETTRTELQVFAGGSANQEFFSTGLRRNSGESVVGEEWRVRLSDATSFTERFTVYQNLNDLGEYRMTFDFTAVTRLNDWLSWQVTLSDRFLSNPGPAKRKNDLLFTTGIRLTLGDGSLGNLGPSSITLQ